MADFYLKQGDTSPDLVLYLEDAYGARVNLTSATVKFILRNTNGTLKFASTATPDADQTLNRGRVVYAWSASDTDTAGEFLSEVEVTFSGGKKQTFPNDGYNIIKISGQLD